jgi:hypothetical protein
LPIRTVALYFDQVAILEKGGTLLFIGIAGMNGFAIFSGQFLAALGFKGTLPPYVFYLISGVICWFLAYKDIRLSSLLAYFLISIAAPIYLARHKELRARHIVIAVLAVLCLLVPTIGSFYPVPPFPVNIFPYIFLAYMLGGGIWLFLASRLHKGILPEIEEDMAKMLQASAHESAPAEPVLVPGTLGEVLGD